jgi:hypothetical protein
MIHPNRLENDSIIAPVVQEAGIVELSLEQLEGIQGGWWFWARLIHSIRSVFAWEAGANGPAVYETASEPENVYANNYYYYSDPGANSP